MNIHFKVNLKTLNQQLNKKIKFDSSVTPSAVHSSELFAEDCKFKANKWVWSIKGTCQGWHGGIW